MKHHVHDWKEVGFIGIAVLMVMMGFFTIGVSQSNKGTTYVSDIESPAPLVECNGRASAYFDGESVCTVLEVSDSGFYLSGRAY